MTVHSRFKEEEVRIARYRKLEREVTDPLAICLLRGIVEELEADLHETRRYTQRVSPVYG
jgi:hypothetical protein